MTTIRPCLAPDRTAPHRTAMALVCYGAIREGTVAIYRPEERAAWASSPEPDRDKPDKLPDQCCLVAEEAGRMTGLMSRAAGA